MTDNPGNLREFGKDLRVYMANFLDGYRHYCTFDLKESMSLGFVKDAAGRDPDKSEILNEIRKYSLSKGAEMSCPKGTYPKIKLGNELYDVSILINDIPAKQIEIFVRKSLFLR